MRPRMQASLDLALYLMFFIPAIAALIYAGYDYAADFWHIREHSNVTAEGPPVYHFKAVIPLAARWRCCRAPRRSRAASSV